jgi:hypothetical protein
MPERQTSPAEVSPDSVDTSTSGSDGGRPSSALSAPQATPPGPAASNGAGAPERPEDGVPDAAGRRRRHTRREA